jgi:hypothetical protein
MIGSAIFAGVAPYVWHHPHPTSPIEEEEPYFVGGKVGA